MNPKISIIVPIYNVESYLANCIESILNQTFKDFELILINDGSTDKSLEICMGYKKLDSRVIVIDKENEGVSLARNIGIKIASGDYITFVDPDDDIEANMYETLINISLENDADVVVCSFKFIDETINEVKTYDIWQSKNLIVKKEEIAKEIIPKILSFENVYGYGIFAVWNKLYKKDIFKQNNLYFDEKRSHGEDKKLNLNIIMNISRMVFINKPLYNYYIRDRKSLTKALNTNLYSNILEDKQIYINICSKYGYRKFIDNIIQNYLNLSIQYMLNIAESDLSNKDKNRIIFNIMNDKTFYENISKYNYSNRFYKLIKNSCKAKMSNIFIIYVKLLKLKEKFMINKRI